MNNTKNTNTNANNKDHNHNKDKHTGLQDWTIDTFVQDLSFVF